MRTYTFKAVLLVDDSRTKYKAGTEFYPKGIYYQKKKVILVGDIRTGSTVRLAFPIASLDIAVIAQTLLGSSE